MKIPEPYQVRLFQEYYDLNEKINKLQFFIEHPDQFNNININEQVRLNEQLICMRSYLNILKLRIEAL